MTDKLSHAIADVCHLHVHARRDRPYTGQPHTDFGERGKTLVTGLTMRDISDCIAMGLLESSSNPALHDTVHHGTWEYNDIYAIDLADIDPGAAIQNALCNVEKMMGIYPNLPDIVSTIPIIDLDEDEPER
jgi:hypothetical protein